MKYKYYYIIVKYELKGGTPRTSGHVIRAASAKVAKDIATRHGIAFPFHSNRIRQRYVERELNEMNSFDFWIIRRRRKGKGGSIWYEDEAGQLQREI